MIRRPATLVQGLVLLSFIPLAYADGVAIEAVVGIGWIGLLIVMTFVVTVESVVWAFAMPMKFDRMVGLMLLINSASLLSGVPVFILKEYLYRLVLPPDLTGQYRWYPVALALVLFLYFVVTIAIEFVVAVAWLRKKDRDYSPRRISAAVLSSNAVSYGVLSALILWSLTPNQTFDANEPIRDWANQPVDQIVFIDPETNFLAAADSNGTDRTTLFSFEMRAYLVNSDLSTCVFLGVDNAWYFARLGQSLATPIGVGNAATALYQVALSPHSDKVAFLIVTGPTKCRLVVFHSDDSSVVDVESAIPESEALLAWSTDEDTLYLQGLSRWKIRLSDSGPDTIQPMSRDEPVKLAPYFGRFGMGKQWRSDHGGYVLAYEQDFCGDQVAFVWFELQSRVLFGRRNPNPEGRGDHFWDIVIGASPKFFPFPQPDRAFRDVAFLPGCNEAVFDDNEFLYLYSISENKLGTISRGHTWILLTDRYAPSLEIPEN